MIPKVIRGNRHRDQRGTIRFNNDFSPAGVRRIYTIENTDTDFVRAWQGHRIEQRWFSAMSGSFKIKLIKIDDWELPSKDLSQIEFNLESENCDVLHVPKGFISSIQAREEHSKLLVFADYQLGEIQDEYRFPADYFKL